MGNAETKNEKLLEAAQFGNMAAVLRLLKIGAEPNTVGQGGLTSVHWAVRNGHLRVLEALLMSGANPDAQTNEGDTALHAAAVRGQKKLVQALIHAGADVDIGNNEGYAPLHRAAQFGRLDIVLLLLMTGADPNLPALMKHISQIDSTGSGWTPLHCAAFKGSLPILEALLEAGANSEATSCSRGGETAAQIAKRYGHKDSHALLVAIEQEIVQGQIETENAASLARRVALTEVGDFLLVDDSMDDVEQDDFLFVEPPTEFGF